jgi:hypothetical protein
MKNSNTGIAKIFKKEFGFILNKVFGRNSAVRRIIRVAIIV